MNIYASIFWTLFTLGFGYLLGMNKGTTLTTRQRDKARATNKALVSRIKGFKTTGNKALSLLVKSLDSINKDKLRTIRQFRNMLTWAEKYLEKSD